jgi:uncharacterized membrane protein
VLWWLAPFFLVFLATLLTPVVVIIAEVLRITVGSWAILLSYVLIGVYMMLQRTLSIIQFVCILFFIKRMRQFEEQVQERIQSDELKMRLVDGNISFQQWRDHDESLSL